MCKERFQNRSFIKILERFETFPRVTDLFQYGIIAAVFNPWKGFEPFQGSQIYFNTASLPLYFRNLNEAELSDFSPDEVAYKPYTQPIKLLATFVLRNLPST